MKKRIVPWGGSMLTTFAIPDYNNVKLVLTVPLGDPITDVLNLVIFFSMPSEVNWGLVKELSGDPNKHFLSRNLSTSPWSYRCCDYSIGALLGLIEELTGKTFVKMPHPVEDLGIGVTYYNLQ